MSKINIDEFLNNIPAQSLNGSDLAYIGDAYYELWMRLYLLNKGITKPSELHKMCIKYVSATSHAIVAKTILPVLTEDELQIFKRGRNYNYRHHSGKLQDYLLSSGFEALIGFLYISKKEERLEEILNKAIEIIENNN